MEGGDTLAAASVEESVSERECKLYTEGLRSNVKLCIFVYRTLILARR